MQGIDGLSDEEMLLHRPGFRFAYQMCFTVTAVGTVLQSVPVLSIAMAAAFFAVFPPNHPFDRLYNLTVGRYLRRPKVPRRTAQGRFACAIATVWLAFAIYFFVQGQALVGTVLCCALLVPSSLVGFFDVCLPSMIYNLMVYRQLDPKKG